MELVPHRVRVASCGAAHTLFLTSTGVAFACGLGSYGRLGTGARESLLTGRNLHDRTLPPTDAYRKMFPAQVIKDAAMAHKLHTRRPRARVLAAVVVAHCPQESPAT